MFSNPKAACLPVWAIAGLYLVAAPAQAAHLAPPADATAPADPVDAKVPVPGALYRSPFAGYRSYSDPPIAPWRDSNELVRQRGGWRAYAREASEPAAVTPPAAAASAPQAAPAGHSGHQMK